MRKATYHKNVGAKSRRRLQRAAWLGYHVAACASIGVVLALVAGWV